jgi:hypothetical protein
MGRLPVAGPIQIPNCIEVRLIWNTTEGKFSNVLHGNLTAAGPINPGLAQTLADAIRAAASTTAWLTHLVTDTSFYQVGIKDLRAPNNPEYLSTATASLGTGVGDPLAYGSALVVTLRTGQSGQGFRGRVYLGGLVAASLLNPKRFTDAVGAAGKNFVDGVNSIMATNQIPLVVAQRALQAGTHLDGSPWEARPAGVLPVTSTDIANPRVDSQRRRLGR